MNNNDKKHFYITSTLPYVNAEPHVGFAMELIRADIVARAKKLQGYEVFFNTGTDEHGQKLWSDAQKAGKDIQDYVDEYASRFRGLSELLSIDPGVHFIRTTDAHHEKAAQAFWKRCFDNGYIYKKNYQSKYCVGCELEKTDSELNDEGRCPIHPNRDLEIIDEENYFFKFSAFGDKLLALYDARPNFVLPEFRLNEIRSFVAQGLQDFSISRLKSKMPWGVAVPNDADHVMYVWFDALVNYISTLGWPDAQDQFDAFWKHGTPVQYCGKDNLRQQSAMWQAMLMAADLPNSHQVVVNGHFTGDGGIKMSKSLGNTVNPYDVVAEYGADALRFFVVGEVSMYEDSPFTMERFKEAYNAKLANGLGNLTNRIMKLAETHLDKPVSVQKDIPEAYYTHIEQFELGRAMEVIFEEVRVLDKYIQETKPFSVVKTDKPQAQALITELVAGLAGIAEMLKPFLPNTAEKMKEAIVSNKMPETPLFLRKE
jgi:methionyl-tRNA synthetase